MISPRSSVRRPHRPRLLAVLALALAVPLALSACAVTPPSGPPTGTAAANSVERLSHDDPKRPVHLQWPIYDRIPALNQLTRAWMERSDRAFQDGNPPSDAVPPELNGTGTEILATGSLVGVRLDVLESTGADAVRLTATFYGDAASGQAWAGTGLIGASHADAVASAILDAAAAKGIAVFEEARTSAKVRARLLDDVAFDRQGNLVALLQECDVTACSEGSPEVSLPAATVAPWLSDAGKSVRAAYAVQPAAPATSPSATPDRPTPAAPTASAPTASATTARVDCSVAKCVALTFDDGPGPSTARLLDALNAADAKATFFVLGECAAAHPELVAREAREGHVVANHTLDHKQLTRLKRDGQVSEVERGADAIAAAGAPRPTLLRPPYGSLNADTKTLGVPLILWDVDTLDWKHRDSAVVTQAALAGAHPGAIILMHDIHPTTVAAVPGILAKLKAQGYTFVTVPELLGTMSPGVVYTSGRKK